MTSETTRPVSKGELWTSYAITAVLAVGLTLSAVMKFLGGEKLEEGMKEFGYDLSLAPKLGVVELTCLILYLIPKTSVLGAILLTGYLGGATATHVRIGDQFFPPIIAGILIWGSLWLRDRRVRDLAPLVTSR